MRILHAITAAVLLTVPAFAGPFAPAAGVAGSTAIPYDYAGIVGWATAVHDLVRGPINISDPTGDMASWGSAGAVLGAADAHIDSLPVVSLGDGGSITVTFARPIRNGPGPDFAVFENGIVDGFLELAFVEVSSNGADFFRFDSISLTQTTTQIGSFGALDPTNINNLAGKYRRGYGTPFDLQELQIIPGLDVNAVTHVRIIDVVGGIAPAYRRLDSSGNPINDPWPTNFETGGFDLDAVAVLNYSAIPEPAAAAFLALGSLVSGLRRRR